MKTLLLAAALLAGGAAARAEVEVFRTSLEATEGKGYEAQALITPQRSYMGWTIIGGNAQIVKGGAEGVPAAPDGEQMLRINPEESAYLSRQLVPVDYSLQESFRFSAVAGFFTDTPEALGGTVFQFFLNNWRKESGNFAGIHFGIENQEGTLRFFYNHTATEKQRMPLSGAEPKPNTFYRFEVDFDAASRLFDVRVYEVGAAGREPVAQASGGVLRGQRPTAEQGFNFLRVLGAAGVTVYLDDVRLNLSQP